CAYVGVIRGVYGLDSW
nr:immunoglobulin heavy chain junction region [Macaca mulatta]